MHQDEGTETLSCKATPKKPKGFREFLEKSLLSEPGDQVQEISYPCACQGRFIHQVLSHVLFGDQALISLNDLEIIL